MPKTALSQADAAAMVLSDAGEPMHRTEITEAILKRGLDVWSSAGPGRTPWESVGRAITQEIANLGVYSRFDYERKGTGVFKLRHARKLRRAENGAAEKSQPSSLVVKVSPETWRLLVSEATHRGYSPAELAERALARVVWQMDNQRAEDQWERSYREVPVDRDELNLWASIRADPGPWEPAPAR